MKLLRDLAIVAVLGLVALAYWQGVLPPIIAAALGSAIIFVWLIFDMRRQRIWREEREAKLEDIRRRRDARHKDTDT